MSRKKYIFSHLRYNDIINFYQMVFIDNYEKINWHQPMKKKKCIILGIYDFDFVKMEKLYKDYLDN